MALALDAFMAQLRTDTELFETAYRKKAEENPEHYPLEMKDGNEGLWLEFFMDYARTGEA